MDSGGLLLSIERSAQDLMLGEQTKKRVASLGAHLQMEPRTEIV